MGKIYHRPPAVGLNRDLNEAPIRLALSEAGATVFSIGWPFDLLVRYGEEWLAVECKAPGRRHRLSRIQTIVDDLDDRSLLIVTTVEEALEAVRGQSG